MTIQMVLQIKPDKLSSYKKNLIVAVVDKIPCGTVLKVLEQIGKDIYNCEIAVYPKEEDRVLKAYQKHIDIMEGK